MRKITPNQFKIPDLPAFIPIIRRTEIFTLIQPLSSSFFYFSVGGADLMKDKFDTNDFVRSNRTKIIGDFFQDELTMLKKEFDLIFEETIDYLKFCGHPLILSPESLIEDGMYAGYGRAIWNRCLRWIRHAQSQIATVCMLPYDSDNSRVRFYVKKLKNINVSGIGFYLGSDGSLEVLKQNIKIVQEILGDLPIIIGGFGSLQKIREFADLGVTTFLVESWEMQGSHKNFLNTNTEKFIEYNEAIDCSCYACTLPVESSIKSSPERIRCIRHNLWALREIIEAMVN